MNFLQSFCLWIFLLAGGLARVIVVFILSFFSSITGFNIGDGVGNVVCNGTLSWSHCVIGYHKTSGMNIAIV